MHPDDLSRPMAPERVKRMAGRTLELAADYLKLTRKATKMREKNFFLFGKWRRERLNRKVQEVQGRATLIWAELYLRFRPVIGAALRRGCRVPLATKRERDAAVGRVVTALEREIERDVDNQCFAELLWQALGRLIDVSSEDIRPLRAKMHARALLEECRDEGVASTLELLCFLRGEQEAPPDLSDIEASRLLDACDSFARCLQYMDDDLDALTAGVLTRRSLVAGHAGQTVQQWVQ